MADHADLIRRLEEATGPSKELDREIALASYPNEAGIWIDCDYTASLDAAVALVPEGWTWTVTSKKGRAIAHMCADYDDDDAPVIWSRRPLGRRPTQAEREACYVATPALALVIAALKARQG